MRSVLSVTCNVIAGFFIYMVELLGFVKLPAPGTPLIKLAILGGFTIPALLALGAGLALNRFLHWKRSVGIVLLSATGFTGFMIFSFACMLMTSEFRAMMKPETREFFTAYFEGGGLIAAFGGLGIFLFISDKPASPPPASVEVSTPLQSSSLPSSGEDK